MVVSKTHANSTVIAHNQSGYDGRFILKWCLNHGLKPTKYIRQESRIMYMSFQKFNLRFIDSMNFLLGSLESQSETYGIDTLKGFFPHHFNTPENQNYIGKIPSKEMYGVNNMTYKKYTKDFEPWYNKECLQENWIFKQAMKDYCRADVELLSKAVLKYRKIFKDKLDVDPFRYITLASLCMAIFRGCFLPEKSIVSSEPNKHVSNVSTEWLIHKQIETTEHPIIM